MKEETEEDKTDFCSPYYVVAEQLRVDEVSSTTSISCRSTLYCMVALYQVPHRYHKEGTMGNDPSPGSWLFNIVERRIKVVQSPE